MPFPDLGSYRGLADHGALSVYGALELGQIMHAWTELMWEYVRIFFLSSAFVAVVAILTRFLKSFVH